MAGCPGGLAIALEQVALSAGGVHVVAEGLPTLGVALKAPVLECNPRLILAGGVEASRSSRSRKPASAWSQNA